jgi:lysozyme
VNIAKLKASIAKHEGCNLRSYLDTVGIWTVGYGRNINNEPDAATKVISQVQADAWLDEDIRIAMNGAVAMSCYQFLDTDARQNAFIEMVFNMGVPRVSKFTGMIAGIKAKNWEKAAAEALDSKWASQVKRRAEILASMLRTGEFPA